jgi:hypothetical protein
VRAHWLRAVALAVAAASLLFGLVTGLVRLGWAVPGVAGLAGQHGPLMVVGFLGTLIGVERAVAIRRWWGYAPPTATAIGALHVLAGAHVAGRWVMAVGTTGLAGVFAQICWWERTRHAAVMATGAALLAAGAVLWATGQALHVVVVWWAAALVLVIAGERLELSRIQRLSAAALAGFAAAAGVLVAGLLVGLESPDLGMRVAGAGLVGLAAWLVRYDIARRTLRSRGLTRFMGWCLLAGYGWLAVAGILWIAAGSLAAGPLYDALHHALFLGFVMSMIFAHAPVILPSVVGVQLPFRPRFYVHVALLHVSLAPRVAAGVTGPEALRRWAGLANVAAIILFALSTALAARRGAHQG